MVNIFQLDYTTRFQSWYELRNQLKTNSDIKTICCEVDAFWQQTPLVNHYIHPSDIDNWPGPWDLIYDNTYCYIARGLGMYYTLTMLGIENLDFFLALDDNDENVALIVVDNKYILNYWPNSVLDTNIKSFKITTTINGLTIKNKIQ